MKYNIPTSVGNNFILYEIIVSLNVLSLLSSLFSDEADVDSFQEIDQFSR